MPFNIAIIDYEIGNLRSIYKCLKYLKVDSIITDDHKIILDADGVILPGVGAFKDAMQYLKQKNLVEVIKQLANEGKPLFGICLGLQLLHSVSFELGETEGLDIINGKIVSFDKKKVDKVPHIGWNNVKLKNMDHFLIQGILDNSFFYFVHSFYAIPKNKEQILGFTKYGKIKFCSIVSKDNIVATQFHPEKSGKNGIKMYKNFIDFCKR